MYEITMTFWKTPKDKTTGQQHNTKMGSSRTVLDSVRLVVLYIGVGVVEDDGRPKRCVAGRCVEVRASCGMMRCLIHPFSACC